MDKLGKRFEGKVAIVTASTQGIGFGIAERLGLEGASVVISSRKQVFFAVLRLLSENYLVWVSSKSVNQSIEKFQTKSKLCSKSIL